MQNAGIAALGLNWRYLAFDVLPENLRAAIEGAKAMKFVGLNLTVPHKLLALEMVDVVDPVAKSWGAVNTIRFEGKINNAWIPLDQCPGEPEEIRSHGFNTDADAVIQAVREDLQVELRGARVLLLGAGGAGRVAALKLAAEGVSELFLVNRTVSKAETIAAELNSRFPGVKTRVGYPEGSVSVDLLLNATSQGLKTGDVLPLDREKFAISKARTVFDMIYRPAETPFLALAREAGCKTANGLGMLLYQGAKALELWSGKKAPVQTMRTALQMNIYG